MHLGPWISRIQPTAQRPRTRPVDRPGPGRSRLGPPSPRWGRRLRGRSFVIDVILERADHPGQRPENPLPLAPEFRPDLVRLGVASEPVGGPQELQRGHGLVISLGHGLIPRCPRLAPGRSPPRRSPRGPMDRTAADSGPQGKSSSADSAAPASPKLSNSALSIRSGPAFGLGHTFVVDDSP